MPMKPHKGESQSDFMSRCVPEIMGQDGGTKRPQDQAVAACMDIWKNKDKALRARELEAPDPDPDESFSEFMERCTLEIMSNAEGDDEIDEDDAAEACQTAWEDRAAPVMHKQHAEPVVGMEFVLSDETIDRYGDVIMSSGWDIENFKNNPIALFNHRSDFPIGRWSGLRVENRALRGRLELAPRGTSDRIDELHKLIDAGILRAVSVGFRPLASEPRRSAEGKALGELYTRSELVETSLVSVPANPNALAIAKSLRVSPATLDLVFAELGNRDGSVRRRSITGELAETNRSNKGKPMSLSQRIQDSEAALNALRDQLTAHLATVDDTNQSEAQIETTNELNERIARCDRGLMALRHSEQSLAAIAAPQHDAEHEIRMPTRHVSPPGARPFTIPSRKIEPADYVWRALTVMVKHYQQRGAKGTADILKETYGDDEGTRAVMGVLTRASSAPALTTATNWAAELVAIVMGEFYKALIPMSVFPKISARGSSFTFGRAGVVTLPMRSTTPTVAGSFVGEGAPIPVRQGQFVTQQMTPKKMAVITTFTREISEHSTPAIEGILRDAVLEDTSVAIDTVLLDNGAATAIRPAGLLNGVTPLTPTAGGGMAALLGDLKQLSNALIVATRGNFRNPAWIMSPALALSIALTPTTGAQALPFREEIAGGTLLGIPVITSTTVTAAELMLVDCADFASVTGDDPRFEVSDQAVLHMEDTSPAAIGSVGTPNVVAAPTRSLWQTDTIGLRMIMPMNWCMRRPTSVAVVQAVTWA